MSSTPPHMGLEDRRQEMHPPQSQNEANGDREYRVSSRDKSERERSHSRDHGREKDKDRERDREREKDKKKRERSRDKDRHRESRDRDRRRDSRERSKETDRDRRRKDRGGSERDRERERRRDSRDRDREPRTQRSRSRTYDEYESRRKRRSRSRSSRRDRERSRSRSYERRRRDRDREGERNRDGDRGRSSTIIDMDRGEVRTESSHLEAIKEETRENRFDLTQTIQELMNSTTSTKNFAALFSCTNSNDGSCSNGPSENSQDGLERKRRKKSRWGGTENDKTFIPGMPTILPSTLDPTQQEAYLVQLQIEEISRKLRTGDLGIPQNPEERSPSPEPIYSSDGKRLNTREFRFRKRLEEQRHQLIQKMQSVNPEFKPPADYKPPVTRVSDKVLIPQEQHPDINFVGLLIGPRGNTLKAMEKETGAKIIIRGKGSVKEGKVGRKDGQPLPGEDEPLHAFITAPNPEAVKKAVDKIKDVIRQGIEVPEGHNDLRRMQLRELAQLNGTLRETDCQRCTNCGSTEHKSWLCPDKPNVTNSIVCTACGGAGHISKDCRSKRPGAGEMPTEDSQAKIDEEYMSLMAELGEGPPPPSLQPKPTIDPLAQVHLNRGYSLFDKKPTTLQAIQGPITSQAPALAPAMTTASMHASAPPPPIPPAWGTPTASAPNMGIPPLMPPWMSAAPPPPPGTTSGLQPPGTGTMKPPIPGLQPPGTGPMPPLIPPPPGTQAPLPPWSAGPSMINPPMPSYGGWGAGSSYMPPLPPGDAPPPPPCAPPPSGMPSLTQPPPPPPPAN